jgi:phosphoglycolate phosphatase-like HAD superfamily hydrolase
MKYKALIFDFDGTLADTLEETRCIYNFMAGEYGLRTVAAEDLSSLRDLSLSELLEHLDISKFRVPSLLARGTSLLRERIASVPIISGLAEVIPAMRKTSVIFGVLTSNSTQNVDLFLRSHGLREYFTFLSSTSKLTGKAKHLRAIRKTFSLQANEVLYVGDEIRDVKASHKAGIDCAAVTWGFNSRASLMRANPQYIIDDPSDLLSMILARGVEA